MNQTFTPSKYQEAIFETIRKIVRDLVIEAVAGSGKTTTVIMGCGEVDPTITILVCAFNKERAEEAGDKLAKRQLNNAAASTIHSLGYRALAQHINGGGKLNKEDYKFHRQADAIFQQRYPMWVDKVTDSGRVYLTRDGRTVHQDLIKLADFVRLTLTDFSNPEAVEKMALRYGLDVNLDQKELFTMLPDLMNRAEEHSRNTGEVDFTDMIYLPMRWDIPVQQYDLVFVDEAQDLNACQLALVMKARKKGGHMVFVGDSKQAIYGFAGADYESIPRIIKQTDAQTLPLSVNYRCPTSVLKLAQEVVPHIEARPDAPEGQVIHLPEEKLYDTAQPGDMILCRLTAPLIERCIEFIKRGIGAKVKGRDIGRQLNAIVDKVTARETFTWEYFLNHLTEYKAQQVKMLRAREAEETQVTSFIDRCEAVAVCYENLGASDPDELKVKITDLFSDKRPLIWLSTIHRAKGDEAPNVFIVRPDALPLQIGGNQQEQEWNLRYVAVTRAQEKLYIVGGEFTPGPYAEKQEPETEAEAESAEKAAFKAEEKARQEIEAEEAKLLEQQIEEVKTLDPTISEQAVDDVLRAMDAETIEGPREDTESTEPPAETETPAPEEPTEPKRHVPVKRPAPPKPTWNIKASEPVNLMDMGEKTTPPQIKRASDSKPNKHAIKPKPAAVRASLEVIEKALKFTTLPDNIPPDMVATAYQILRVVLTEQPQENPDA